LSQFFKSGFKRKKKKGGAALENLLFSVVQEGTSKKVIKKNLPKVIIKRSIFKYKRKQPQWL
jgi:hypothetical protein